MAGNLATKITISADDNPHCLQISPGRSTVRRLLPLECEFLMGFPAWYTLIPYGQPVRPEKLEADWAAHLMRGGARTLEECRRAAADGPRYKALGNSMAVPVMHWLGERLQAALEPFLSLEAAFDAGSAFAARLMSLKKALLRSEEDFTAAFGETREATV